MSQTQIDARRIARDVARWRFPGNDNGEIRGINDAGVHTFSANSFRSLVRESIQNSLDAALDSSVPVEVEFEQSTIRKEEYPQSASFRRVLDACSHMSGNSEDAQVFFDEAKSVFDAGEILVLRISDFGTSGLTGADTCAIGTHWSRLVKESGSSSKGATSGGSFGIGKYATFACSSFRTVFFSSLDQKGIESSIGVTRLVSFRDFEHDDRLTTGVGYFADNEMNVAMRSQLDLPCSIMRKPGQSGTDVYVLGFKECGDFVKDTIFSVLEDFLVSIWKEKLVIRVKVDGYELVVDKKHLGEFINLIPSDSEDQNLRDTINHYQLLSNMSSTGVHVVDLDPVDINGGRKWGWKKGDCQLIFMEGENLNRTVMITRAAGMRLFEKGHISGSIYFTGILMIKGEAMNRDFREMEAPSHDSWSPELAQDSAQAKYKMDRLFRWIKHTVVSALTKPIEDVVDAYGASLFLPHTDNSKGIVGEPEQNPESIEKTASVITVKATTPKRQDPMATEPASIQPDAEGDATRKGSNPGKGTGASGGSASGDKEGFTYVPVRQRLTGTGARGLYRVRVEIPYSSEKAQLKIGLKGEKASFAARLANALVVKGNAQIIDIKDDKITFGPVEAGESLIMEFDPDFDQYCQMEVSYYAAQ